MEEAKKNQEATRQRYRGVLGDPDFLAQVGREEKEGRISADEAAAARRGPRARGTLGVEEDQAAADQAAAEARAKAMAQARDEETRKLDELIVAGRERVAVLEREKQLSAETYKLREGTRSIQHGTEDIGISRKAEEDTRRREADEAGRALGTDVQRGLKGIGGKPASENAELVRGVDRAAAALADGTTAGELNTLYSSIDRLADAAEKQGSVFTGHLRRMQAAIETRIAKIEAQLARVNDTR